MRSLLFFSALFLLSVVSSCKKDKEDDACDEQSSSVQFKNESEFDLTVEVSQSNEANQEFTAVSLNFIVQAGQTKEMNVEAGDRFVRWSACNNGGCSLISINKTNFISCEQYVESSGGFNASDYRYKKNIHSLDQTEITHRVMQLNPKAYEYDFIKFPGLHAVQGTTYGFIAQDLEKIFPQTVVRNDQGYRSVNYVALIPVLTAVIQQQQIQLDILASQIAELKKY